MLLLLMVRRAPRGNGSGQLIVADGPKREPARRLSCKRSVPHSRPHSLCAPFCTTAELWDPRATEAAQRARDAEIREQLDIMCAALRAELGERPAAAASDVNTPGAAGAGAAAGSGSGAAGSGAAAGAGATAAGAGSGGAAEEKQGGEAMEGVEGAATAEGAGRGEAAGGSGGGEGEGEKGKAQKEAVEEAMLGPEGCAAAVRSSCLLPFLLKELQMASFADMGAR